MKIWTHLIVPVVALQLALWSPTPARAGDFVGAAGNYGGIIGATEPGNGEVAESGLVQIQVRESGAFSGSVMWQNQRYPLKGVLADDGTFSKTVAKNGVVEAVGLTFSFTLTKQDLSISGELIETPSGSPSPTLTVPFALTGAPAQTTLLEPGLRVSFIDPVGGTGDPAPQTMTEPAPVEVEVPGDGFSQVRIGNADNRSARIVGRLPDHDGAFSAGSPLRGNKYSVFSSLYRQKKARGGQLFGQPTVQNNGSAVPEVKAELRWGKAQGFDPNYYPGKIDRSIVVDALPYPKLKRGALPPLLPPGSEARVFNAKMTFRRGNLHIPRTTEEGVSDNFFTVNLAVTPFQSRIVGPNPYKVKITVNALAGSFRGSFVHPGLNAKANFKGAFQSSLLTVPGIGRGSFKTNVKDPEALERLGEPLESGRVTLAPQQ